VDDVAAAVLQLIKVPGFDTASDFKFDDPYNRWTPDRSTHRAQSAQILQSVE
jgi:hypothetical protein